MPSIAYVNGQFLPLEEAKISILDRGFLFADGVYEVTAVIGGRLIDGTAHLARLRRSLDELELVSPTPMETLPQLMQELVTRAALDEGLVYIQITRGADVTRDFAYPNPADVPSTLVMFGQQKALVANALGRTGGAAITVPDIRWKRRDIKSVALLPQTMGKQLALQAGAIEALMVEDGYITEATSAAVGIITKENVLVTRPPTSDVLDSVTRRAMLALAKSTDLAFEERLFTPEEAYDAAEVFVASATALITPIIAIDGRQIGDGTAGPYAPKLRQLYLAAAVDGHQRLTNHDYPS